MQLKYFLKKDQESEVHSKAHSDHNSWNIVLLDTICHNTPTPFEKHAKKLVHSKNEKKNTQNISVKNSKKNFQRNNSTQLILLNLLSFT